jgi:hypothetical protein
MTKIPDLTNYTTPAANDLLVIEDVANATSKKVTVTNLLNAVDLEPGTWKNPYCFKAYNSVTTSLTDNTSVKVLFQTEVYDYGNDFASSTYTAPVAGVYSFSACVAHASASASPVFAQTRLHKNGSVVAYGDTILGNTTVSGTWSVNCDLLLAANDTIEIWHIQDSGGVETTSTGEAVTWFSGHLVHAV